MDVNGITRGDAENGGALPSVAQYVRILLVDHDTTSLMSVASKFEQQLYKVTATESAKVALGLFEEQTNYYDIVIANFCIPEMRISEFVEKLHGQRTTVPIILIAKELTNDLAREAIDNGVCYVYSKPPSRRDISNLWLHIPRVTGEMRALFDMTNYTDIDKDGSIDSRDSRDGVAGNQKWNNLNLKLDNTDRESVKRKKNHITENPNPSNDEEEEDSHNTKKPRVTWTSYLDDKFLQAINVLGEHGARPRTILGLMNEPNLTPRHVASHLQKYRRQRRQSLNLQKIGNPVMSTMLPAATLNSVVQEQTFDTSSSTYVTVPNFGHYSFYEVKQDQHTFNHSGNNSVNTIINDGVQVSQGKGGRSKGLLAPTQELEGASGCHSKDLEAPNQKPTSKFGTVLCGFGKDGNMGKMKCDNLGEGTSGSNQQFDGIPSNEDINQFIQDSETLEVDIWDWFK